MACGPTPCAPTAGRRTRMRSTSRGTAHSGSRPRRHGVRGCETRRRPSPSLGDQTSGRPTCGGQASFPSGWRRGVAGTPRQVPIPPVRHVPGGPCRPHGRRPRGPGEPRGLPIPGPAATAAPQPLPLGRLCRPPPKGCGPQPAAPPARCPAGLAVAPGFCPGLGHSAGALASMAGPAEVS